MKRGRKKVFSSVEKFFHIRHGAHDCFWGFGVKYVYIILLVVLVITVFVLSIAVFDDSIFISLILQY